MRALLTLTLLAGCSDYDLSPPVSPEEGVSDDDSNASQDVDESDADGDTDNPDDAVVEGPPDDFGTIDCANGSVATWQPGEVVVLSHDTGPSSGVLNSPRMGAFHIYDIVPAESGAGQTNELMFLRVTNATEAIGLPISANCGGDYVVPDPDNAGSLPTDTPNTSEHFGWPRVTTPSTFGMPARAFATVNARSFTRWTTQTVPVSRRA